MSQPVFEDGRFVRVRYDRVPASQGVLIATVSIEPPPTNVLSSQALDELATHIERLEERDHVKAVVISGHRAGGFVTGIDARELLEAFDEPSQARALAIKAQSLFIRIEAMAKPVIAAMDGPALGGGCELAMACHYRIGNRRTRMGLPGIQLFLPPGFGGSQRLPRLLEDALGDTSASTSIALGWLLCGRPIAADIAKDGGLLDEIVSGSTDVLSRARLLAAQCARGTSNPVAEAAGFRRQQRARWDEPELVDWQEIEQDPYLCQCLAQSRHAGRGAVAEAILGLVRTGLEEGIQTGFKAEIETFARFVVDTEQGGKKGIPLFLDQRAPALPLRRRVQGSAAELKRLEDEYWLLPIGSPFAPGVTPLPEVQYAWAVVKDPTTGNPDLGEPKAKEKEILLEVPRPTSNDALLYVLASEINRMDASVITGVPNCAFDQHDEDEHVTGSGGLGLVVELGEAVQAEARLQVGDVVAIHPGRCERLELRAGAASPRSTHFRRQGYDTPDGSHQQFMLAQGAQCLRLPAGLTLEAAGSFIATAGAAYRCLFDALESQPGKRMLVEGAAFGTGYWAAKLGLAGGIRTTGVVSSAARAAAVRELGAGAVNRGTEDLAGCFTPVPADPSRWAEWQAQGRAWLAAVRAENDQTLMDYAISQAGDGFARSFQALAEGGSMALHDPSSGGQVTFLGKPGTAGPADMLRRARLRPGENVVVYYGIAGDEDDAAGVELLKAIHTASSGRIVVITRTEAQRQFVRSQRLGKSIAGVLSIEALAHREPAFLWRETLPELPDSHTQGERFKEAMRAFRERTVNPLGQALGELLQDSNNPCGVADVIIERAQQNTLALSALLARPDTGRILYCEDMAERRYSFYAPPVCQRQCRILMPTACIIGIHLCTTAEAEAVCRLVEAAAIEVPPVHLFDWRECPDAHQAAWEQRLTSGAGNAMLNHALPDRGIQSADELVRHWSEQTAQRGG